MKNEFFIANVLQNSSHLYSFRTMVTRIFVILLVSSSRDGDELHVRKKLLHL
jgi:hypothetical protein